MSALGGAHFIGTELRPDLGAAAAPDAPQDDDGAS